MFGGQEKAADNDAPDNRDSPAPNAVEGGNNTGVREILIRLLERLSLPDDLMKQVDAIREKIEVASSNSSWEQLSMRRESQLQFRSMKIEWCRYLFLSHQGLRVTI